MMNTTTCPHGLPWTLRPCELHGEALDCRECGAPGCAPSCAGWGGDRTGRQPTPCPVHGETRCYCPIAERLTDQ